MRRAVLLLVPVTALVACGGGGETGDVAAPSAPSLAPYTPSDELAASKQSAEASTSAAATSAAVATPSSTEVALELQQALVTNVTADAFAKNEDTLSDELVKSSSLIEAQTDFRFDRETRTLVLAVTSVFDTGDPQVPYGLATDFARVFWGPESSGAVSPEALPLFSVTVDDATYVCEPTAMVALADQELSEEQFIDSCGR